MAHTDGAPVDQQPSLQELSEQFHDRYDAIEREIDEAKAVQKEAVESRKNLRKIIKGAGINLPGFDRARADLAKSGEVREEENAEYHRQMAWKGKPVKVGQQSAFDFEAEPEVPEIQIRRVQEAGHGAGKNGSPRSGNPWTPGTLLHAEFDGGWCQGRQEWETSQEANAQQTVPRRGPGRPRKENTRDTVAPTNGAEAAAQDAEPRAEAPPPPRPSRSKRKGISFDTETEGSA